jgi:ribonuclease D
MRPQTPTPLSISRESLANLPIRRYEGEIRLVATDRDFGDAIADLRNERVVGLDTETRPAFRKGESHLPCLVQAATARAVYLFQLKRAEAFPVLAELLGARHIVKAGVALAHDLRCLKLVFAFEPANVVDLGTAARRAGFDQTGVRNLAGLVLGFRIPKGNSTSNWAARELSASQIAYAATDAWACRELYLRFEALGLVRPGE